LRSPRSNSEGPLIGVAVAVHGPAAAAALSPPVIAPFSAFFIPSVIALDYRIFWMRLLENSPVSDGLL
jgi:hypothetical protein